MLSRLLMSLIILCLSTVAFTNIISGECLSTSKIDGIISQGYFSSSVANVNDLDNNGMEDIIVGVPFSDAPYTNSGSVDILFMEEPSIYNRITIDANTPVLTDSILTEDMFGSSVGYLGDFYGNGNTVIGVGAPGADLDGYSSIGCLWILELNSAGTILSGKRIKYADTDPGSIYLFGSSVATVNGVNGLNNRVLVVGSSGYDTCKGCILILKVNIDNTVTLIKKITGDDLGFSTHIGDFFGTSIANAGDLDNNGTDDLYVGSPLYDSSGFSGNGAFYTIYLNSDGSVKNYVKNLPATLGIVSEDYCQFGHAISVIKDIDRDGDNEVVVSSYQRDEDFTNRGGVDIFSMDIDDNLVWSKDLNSAELNSYLYENEMFGSGLTNYMDLNENGIPTLIVGASNSLENTGALFFINLSGPIRTDSVFIESSITTRFNCTANTKGIDTDLYFEYGLSESLGDTVFYDSPINSTTGEVFTKRILNLINETTYYYRAVSSNENGISRGEIVSFETPPQSSIEDNLPLETKLYSCYPNPFNPETTIKYSIGPDCNCPVRLGIYNSKGELVKILVNEKKGVGNYSIKFNGEGLNSGVYIYNLKADGVEYSGKMILIK